MTWLLIQPATSSRRAFRPVAVCAVALALALSGCAPAGPPLSLDRGDGEEVRVAAVDRDDFVETFGEARADEAVESDEADGADGADEADEATTYYYLFDPPVVVGEAGDALLVATSALPAGSHLRLFDRDGTVTASVRRTDVPAALSRERREHVLHPGDGDRIHGMIVDVPPGREPPESAGGDTPVASLSSTTRLFGAVLTGDALRLGAGTRLSASSDSALEWTVELPTADGAAATTTEEGRLEIDYVVDSDVAADADAATSAARRRVARATIDVAGQSTGRETDAETASQTAVSYRARLGEGSGTIAIPAPALGFVPAVVTVRSGNEAVAVRRVQWHESTARRAGTADGADINAPIPADLATILSDYPQSAWRRDEFEVFSWTAYPRILVFDTADYETQSRLFKRLAFFVEKRGFRGRLLSDEELSGRHGWNAHNYRPEGLSAFFAQAEADGVRLTAEEELLREVLLANGVIHETAEGYEPGDGGVLSLSQSSYPELRELLITHEAYHGLFYEEAAFRDGVTEIWNGLSEAERSYWRSLLAYMTYDPADEYLMINEFQAYLMQQPLDRVRGYLRGVLAPRFANARPSQREEIERFLAEHPETFIRAARAVEELLSGFSPLAPGDVLLLRPADGGA